jgi:hypothetical protein
MPPIELAAGSPSRISLAEVFADTIGTVWERRARALRAGAIAAALVLSAACGSEKHSVDLRRNQPVYATTSDHAACGRITEDITLTATDKFNHAIETLAQDGFEAATLGPYLAPDEACPDDGTLWTRRAEGA